MIRDRCHRGRGVSALQLLPRSSSPGVRALCGTGSGAGADVGANGNSRRGGGSRSGHKAGEEFIPFAAPLLSSEAESPRPEPPRRLRGALLLSPFLERQEKVSMSDFPNLLYELFRPIIHRQIVPIRPQFRSRQQRIGSPPFQTFRIQPAVALNFLDGASPFFPRLPCPARASRGRAPRQGRVRLGPSISSRDSVRQQYPVDDP